ncbi:MAG: hypothetical protein JWM15_2630, partial [Cryptosporangiaceae bacterium]|nr:hypothetical protein [Cryptosporangiaceae bacterium]
MTTTSDSTRRDPAARPLGPRFGTVG